MDIIKNGKPALCYDSFVEEKKSKLATFNEYWCMYNHIMNHLIENSLILDCMIESSQCRVFIL